MLRATRRARCECQSALLRQRVDRGRLAGIAATDKGDFGRSCAGSWSSRLAVVRKRAAWIHANARLAARAVAAGSAPGVFIGHCKISGFVPSPDHCKAPSDMKSPLLLLLAIALSAPVLANESKPAPKADLAKGQAIATQVCGACHSFDGSRGLAVDPDPARTPCFRSTWPSSRPSFKSGARNRHHEGLCQHAVARGHAQRGRLLCVQDREAGASRGTRTRW